MTSKSRENPMLLQDQELVILRGLWQRHPATAAAVQMHLMAEGERLPYTSVSIVLNSLFETGGVKRRKIKGTYVYEPVWTLDQIAQTWLKYLKAKIYS